MPTKKKCGASETLYRYASA